MTLQRMKFGGVGIGMMNPNGRTLLRWNRIFKTIWLNTFPGKAKNGGSMSKDVEFKGISFTSDKFWSPKHGEEFVGDIIVINLGEVQNETSL